MFYIYKEDFGIFEKYVINLECGKDFLEII